MDKFDRERFQEKGTGDGKVYRLNIAELSIMDKLDELVGEYNKMKKNMKIMWDVIKTIE